MLNQLGYAHHRGSTISLGYILPLVKRVEASAVISVRSGKSEQLPAPRAGGRYKINPHR